MLVICGGNLRLMSVALQMYASDEYGYFPDKLGRLWDKGILTSTDAYMCPAVKRRKHQPFSADNIDRIADYLYRPSLKINDSITVAILSDRYGNHHNGFLNFVLSDGSLILGARVVNNIHSKKMTSPKTIDEYRLWELLDITGEEIRRRQLKMDIDCCPSGWKVLVDIQGNVEIIH